MQRNAAHEKDRAEQANPRAMDGRIPIVVAGTGHRDIAPKGEEILFLAVRAKLQEIMKRFPNSPFRALSGLAEGADMVFAEAALDLGMDLIAVLPAEPEVFVKDFLEPAHPERSSEAIEARFRTIIKQCADQIVVAPHLPANDSTRYVLVGEYLVRHCHVLIALWDGETTISLGGTHHVVSMARGAEGIRGQEKRHRDIDPPAPRLVHHLHTPRRTLIPVEQVWSRFPETDPAWQAMQAPLNELDDFNADTGRHRELLAAEIRAKVRKYTPKGDPLSLAEHATLEAYAAADILACGLQRHLKLTIRVVFSCALCMLLTFGVFSHFSPRSPLLLVYLCAFLIPWVLFAHDRKRKIHNRYVNYRGLAEGLRVKYYYMLAGIPLSPSHCYTRKHRGEMAWMREALNGLAAGSLRGKALGVDIITDWVGGQANYFADRLRSIRKLMARSKFLSLALYTAGIAASVVTLAFALLTNVSHHHSAAYSAAIFLMGHLAAAGALVSAYSHHMGYSQLVKEYERMHSFYARVQLLLDTEQWEDDAHLQSVAHEVGHEALEENAAWVTMHRERPIDPKW